MTSTVITKKVLTIPAAIITEVAEVLLEAGIMNDIVGSDTEIEELQIEVQYEREQRDAIHRIEDMVSDYEESDDDEEDEDEDEEED